MSILPANLPPERESIQINLLTLRPLCGRVSIISDELCLPKSEGGAKNKLGTAFGEKEAKKVDSSTRKVVTQNYKNKNGEMSIIKIKISRQVEFSWQILSLEFLRTRIYLQV